MSPMHGQPEAPPPPCAWCGQPAFKTRALQPARYGTRKGVRVIVKPAQEVNVCDEHAAMVDRNLAEREARKAAEKAAKQASL
jgi:hypothetical protein